VLRFREYMKFDNTTCEYSEGYDDGIAPLMGGPNPDTFMGTMCFWFMVDKTLYDSDDYTTANTEEFVYGTDWALYFFQVSNESSTGSAQILGQL
jgi:hypothetical protein